MKAKKIIHVKEEGAKVLLIGDMAGYGKISLGAMIPIMSHMGFNLYNLPTALVSNTLDYGLFEILDTTDYMKNTLKVWKKLGFSFDAICTGLIVSEEQVKVVAEYCRQQQREGKRIFVDPIMGDDGVLYNGVSENTVGYMRQLCSVADIIMPNYTEAVFLSGKQEGRIIINGSTSAAPLIEELAEGYEAYNPNAEIVIEKSDSTKGINDAMQGRCDMAMVSRELESYEQELLQYEAIAKEGIAIIVNEENPIENITIDQIRDIYNGRIKAWSDLDQKK